MKRTSFQSPTIPEYVVKLPGRGGRGVLAGSVIMTAAHCLNFSTDGEMVLGDHYIEEVKAGSVRLKLKPLVVEPLSDIALLGALDEQVFPDEVEAFEEFCAKTPSVPLFKGRIKRGKQLAVRILGHHGRWIDGSVGLFNEAAPSLWLEADDEVAGGSSGGPIVSLDGELVAIVSNASKPQGGLKSTGCCPRPLHALPVWACLLYFGVTLQSAPLNPIAEK